MRLRRLTVAGFRGINSERVIDLNDGLTLIGAPNSHGKTSISESLEFLIYGATSKVAVQGAQSKEEYKDSYRNRHFPTNLPAYVVGEFADAAGHNTVLRVELDANGTVRRFVDAAPVQEWPFKADMDDASRPFILQHALKNLLLVPPAERFQGFAQLLGLNEVDVIHKALVSLCTKPEANLPAGAPVVIEALTRLTGRMAPIPELKKACANLKKGRASLTVAYRDIEERADVLVGKSATQEERVAKLVKSRNDAATKVFGGTVGVSTPVEPEVSAVAANRKVLETSVSAAFLDDYGRLAARGAAERVRNEATLLQVGVALLDQAPGKCPLCTQPLSEELERHLRERHVETRATADKPDPIEEGSRRVDEVLRSARQALVAHHKVSARRSAGLITATTKDSREKIERLLGPSAAGGLPVISSAAEAITPLRAALADASGTLDGAVAACETARQTGREELAQAERLADAINKYLAAADTLRTEEDRHEIPLAAQDRQLRLEVDRLAGTTEISLVLDLLEKRSLVGKALRILDLLEDVRTLKKHAEQTLAETMDAVLSADLTRVVMDWYTKIKTAGDPDVHFAGFAMEKTKGGDYKNRKLAVKASSYGVELASAVSSLSESKLNALGLCVSIASAIRAPGPWTFLIIDDPIQSWDAEHETQFITVIRELVEKNGKQVVVLSHKRDWANQVRNTCRTLNGFHYDITGYTKDGPVVVAVEWAPLEQRLREADSIAKDPAATPDRHQQAEQEIRIAACQLASRVADVKLKRQTSPHNMNKGDVRAILLEAGVPLELTDRVFGAFAVSDNAHHAPAQYNPTPQRTRQGLAALQEVLKWLDSK